MRELRIEEQMNICGGTMYEFTDLTTGSRYFDTDFNALKRRRASESKAHPNHTYSVITP